MNFDFSRINKYIDKMKFKFFYCVNMRHLVTKLKKFDEILILEKRRIERLNQTVFGQSNIQNTFIEYSQAFYMHHVTFQYYLDCLSCERYNFEATNENVSRIIDTFNLIYINLRAMNKLGYPPLFKLDRLFYALLEMTKEIEDFKKFYFLESNPLINTTKMDGENNE